MSMSRKKKAKDTVENGILYRGIILYFSNLEEIIK